MDLLKKSDKEILEIASPLWDNLIICSNSQDYFGFTKDFSARMLFGANEIELAKMKREIEAEYDESLEKFKA